MEHTIGDGIHDLLAALAISQLLLMGAAYFLNHRQELSGKLLILYCAGVIAYLLSKTSLFAQLPAVWSSPIHITRITIPVVFWLLTHSLFNDTGKFPRILLAAFGLYLFLRVVEVLVVTPGFMTIDLVLYELYMHIRRIFVLMIITHACFMAVQGHSADLMADRRHLRPLFVLTMGSIIMLITGSQLFSIHNDTAMSIYLLAIFVATFIFNIRMFQLQDDFKAAFRPVIVQEDSQSQLSGTERLCYQKLISALNQDKLYAQPGLTLNRLAAVLHMKDYRLREFINKKLHYRNFNQFINDFRLNLAVAKLSNLDDGRTLVSTIAWDLGYSSPSSFNKVFKEKFGVTPSEYRKGIYESLKKSVAA